jgi:hypothetical protein
MEKGPADAAAVERMHAALRFSVGISMSFVVCEAMAWKPAYLTAILTGALLANLPGRPPLKLGVVIVAAMTLSAALAWLLSTLLLDMPWVLFGAITLFLFIGFLALLTGGPAATLPATLLLVCLSTIPVVALAYPSQAAALPQALVRGMVLAMLSTWLVYAIWPRRIAPKPAAPPARNPAPVATALLATGIVVPIMLVFLLFVPAHALAVLINTVLMVANFDLHLSQSYAIRKIGANAVGGVIGLIAFWTLLIHPTLITLGLITFIVSFLIGLRVAEGGPSVPTLVFGTTAMLCIFGTLVTSGPGDPGIWVTRILYFSLAGAFAVGTMYLVWHWLEPRAARRAGAGADTL